VEIPVEPGVGMVPATALGAAMTTSSKPVGRIGAEVPIGSTLAVELEITLVSTASVGI
jgi:hypothetical protein